MMVVVFGDFACAFSHLASRRVARLAEHSTDVAWPAVHRPIGAGRGERPPGNPDFEVMAVESRARR